MKTISIVVPMFNEENNVEPFFAVLQQSLAAQAGWYDFEYLCINDGSRDATLDRLLALKRGGLAIKIINFSRNFGKEAALTAGLDFAQGDAVIPIDADLQHPPDKIPEMLRLWEQGHAVVQARRTDRRHETLRKRGFSHAFYRLASAIFEMPMERDVGDFRLMDRKVVDAIKNMREKSRFMKGIFVWPGFEAVVIEYDVAPRHQGQSSFGFWKLCRFAVDGITSFSILPLRLSTYLGLLVSLLAIGYGLYILCKTVLLGVDVPGYASLMIVVLFLAGVQLVGIGVLGEYVGKIYQEVKNRPIYVVRDVF